MQDVQTVLYTIDTCTWRSSIGECMHVGGDIVIQTQEAFL